MANFIKPYNDDPFVGHLATPITSSAVTRALLKNLPAYRFGLTPLLRGLEIGLAHGYFLIGPFTKLGPLRNSDIALFAGFLSTIGLILILTLGLTIYGVAAFEPEKESSEAGENDLQTRKAWDQFKGGFFVGACGSAGFALICLSSIPQSIL
uniref:Photosystem I reaction center subunit XI n=1 Tax=Chaetoceros curvisetus TaxID=230516 RepID=A0A8F5JAF3_9STRA|nr:photosystem I reaction center subunit XI [Chaetoceros curvisetus]